MTDLHQHQSTSDSLPELSLADQAEARRRSRVSVWAGGAVAAAATVAIIGYALTGTGGAQTTTTTTDSTAASQFTEADSNGVPDSAEADSDLASGFVIRTDDGNFINYITSWDLADGAGQTTAVRSTDGENWQPVELAGFPQGQLGSVLEENGQIVARISDFEIAEPSGPPSSVIAISTDGINWVQLASPEPASTDGYTNQIEAFDATRLIDGRYLVVGSQISDLDFAALGIDGNDICGYSESGFESEDGTTTGTLEVEHCDGKTETIDIAPLPMSSGSNVLWTVDADGTNPTLIDAPRPGLAPGYDGLVSTNDAVTVNFINPDNPEIITVGTTRDAVSWDTQDRPNEGNASFGQTTSHDGTTYRTTMPSDGAVTERIERSNDGGNTWTATAPLGANDSVQFIATGPAGVVAVTTNYGEISASTFDYVADDGTHLTGEIPDGETTWVLTTPSGESFEYHVDGSVFEPTASGQSDPNVMVEMSDIGELVFTILSPNDGSTLLTVSGSELEDAAFMASEDAASEAIDQAISSMSATAEKDGYVLSMQGTDDMTATYSLVSPDGTELLSGSLDDNGNPSGEGVEILGEAMMPEMRFFDPTTGQDYVTFTAGDLADALMGAAATAMEKVSTPFNVEQDGYTLSGTIPAGEWSVTNADGEVIATFASPIFDSFLSVGSDASSADDVVRTVDPLSKDVTVLENGSPIVTFTFADIVGTSGEIVEGFASVSQGTIYFSADQGATWQELAPINGWINSLAVGDDEVLVTSDTAAKTPVRLPVARN